MEVTFYTGIGMAYAKPITNLCKMLVTSSLRLFVTQGWVKSQIFI